MRCSATVFLCKAEDQLFPALDKDGKELQKSKSSLSVT